MDNDEKLQEAESEYKKAEELESKSQFFNASFYYKNSLKMYREVGDSAKQKICKGKLVEMNKKAVNEFHEVGFEQKIPKEKMEQEMKELFGLMDGDLSTVLDNIGRCATFNPKIKDIEKTANSPTPLSAMIATNVTFDEKGNIVKGSDDGMYSWKMQIYRISQGIITELYLNKLFNALISSGKFTAKDLISEFEKKKFISEGDLKILTKGIEAYFEKDYVSALHILVPKLEALFLKLSEALGVDIIGLGSGKEISTQTRTLSEAHLDSPTFRGVWGDDLCEQLNFVLFRPLGYKLRHRVAHGDITFEECNFTNATLVLYFYIVLLTRVKRK